MKKKALSLLLAATTVTTLLAGCGGKKEEAPAATTAASAEAESTAGGQPEGEIDKSQLITIIQTMVQKAGMCGWWIELLKQVIMCRLSAWAL